MTVVLFGGESDMAPAIQEMFAKEDIVCHCLTKIEADVRNAPSLDTAINYYKPTLVINLAGVSNIGTLKDTYHHHFREEVETNLIGAFNVAKACIKKDIMMIFMGSVAGKYGKPGHAGYSASKAGVISLVQSLGMEGYKAYCISPGRVDTKMREKDFPGERKETRLEPREIAEVVSDIVAGEYAPGDNIIIRRKGTETQPIQIDKGEPWKTELQVGQPPTV